MKSTRCQSSIKTVGTSHGKKLCKHCKRDVSMRNPSGFCDHLYYPNYCDICSGKREDWEKEFDNVWLNPNNTFLRWGIYFKGKEKIGRALKRDIGDYVKVIIRSLLARQREELINRNSCLVCGDIYMCSCHNPSSSRYKGSALRERG